MEENGEQERISAWGADHDFASDPGAATGGDTQSVLAGGGATAAGSGFPGEPGAMAHLVEAQPEVQREALPGDSLHALPTDLSLIAVGGASSSGNATASFTTLRSRPRLRVTFPRGRLALLGPLAAGLLIVGVVLSGLGLQGRNIANLVSAPFGAQAHATATLAAAATAPLIVPTPTPRPTKIRDPMPARNAAMGCSSGAPPAQYAPVYTSKNFQPGAPPPNEVALTFDDGPTPYTTPPILDYLEQNHVPATFFVEGSYARIWPYLVQREWNSGFAIGMHSWDHPVLTILPDSQMPHQFGESLDAIHAAIGKDACIWFWRPPYGSYNPRILGIAQSYGLTTVMWDNDSVDYSRPGPERIAATVLSEARPGGVILMHDGPARREQTLAALPLILEGLKAHGLKPVTLPQLLADSNYPGVDVSKPPIREKPDPTI